jgi:hypothetical protein
MRVTFAIYGPDFDAIEFMLKAECIPSRYILWEDEPLMEDPCGVTLWFDKSEGIFPDGLIRFMLANGKMLESEYNSPEIIKEVSILLEDKDVMHQQRPAGYMQSIPPLTLGMLASANIHFYISLPFETRKK